MAVSGFIWLRYISFRPIINVFIWTAINVVQLILAVFMVLTIIFTAYDKTVAVTVGQLVILWFSSLIAKIVFLFTVESLKEFISIARSGVYVYSGPDIGEYEIKKIWIKQLRSVMQIYRYIVLFTLIFTTFCVPSIKWILKMEGDYPDIINAYLPQPIYMPFDTNTVPGYLGAFVLTALLFATILPTCIMQCSLTISSSIQLTAQLEVLNFSLNNIEKRALLRLKRDAGTKYELELDKLYCTVEFQRCLYYCLVENAQHFQAIMR